MVMMKISSNKGRGKNIAKGTTDPRVEFILPKSPLEVISQVQTQILIKFIFKISTKHQLLSQTLASPMNLKFKILTKPSFKITTNIQLLQNISRKKTGQPQILPEI